MPHADPSVRRKSRGRGCQLLSHPEAGRRSAGNRAISRSDRRKGASLGRVLALHACLLQGALRRGFRRRSHRCPDIWLLRDQRRAPGRNGPRRTANATIRASRPILRDPGCGARRQSVTVRASLRRRLSRPRPDAGIVLAHHRVGDPAGDRERELVPALATSSGGGTSPFRSPSRSTTTSTPTSMSSPQFCSNEGSRRRSSSGRRCLAVRRSGGKTYRRSPTEANYRASSAPFRARISARWHDGSRMPSTRSAARSSRFPRTRRGRFRTGLSFGAPLSADDAR